MKSSVNFILLALGNELTGYKHKNCTIVTTKNIVKKLRVYSTYLA